MLRKEAVALVKELLANNLIQTTWLSIEERKPNGYAIRFKGGIDRYLIETFLQKNNFTLEENVKQEYFVINKKQEP